MKQSRLTVALVTAVARQHDFSLPSPAASAAISIALASIRRDAAAQPSMRRSRQLAAQRDLAVPAFRYVASPR